MKKNTKQLHNFYASSGVIKADDPLFLFNLLNLLLMFSAELFVKKLFIKFSYPDDTLQMAPGI